MNNHKNPQDKSREKTVLITGCSSGIGKRAAEMLKQRGYRVFATARKQKDVDKLLQQGFESVRLNLADSVSIRSAVSFVLQHSDQIHVLFNNGAYGQTGAVEDLSREALREQFETNVFGTIELTNEVLAVMRRQGYGRIVQNSSILGFIALAYRGAYNASKYALEGFSDTLRLELKGSGIYISLVEPGPITSRFRQNALHYFKKYIDVENSVHREHYRQQEARLEKEGSVIPFTLPPDAVVKKLIHAMEARRPKARYYVTLPTYLFGFLKRILPTRLLDRLLIKI